MDELDAMKILAGGALAKFAADVGSDGAKKMLEPTWRAIGEPLRDYLLDGWRIRQRIAGDAEQHLRDSGYEVSPVPGRILWPLLNMGSLDTEGQLREQWASMLANASIESDRVPPYFPRILADMSPAETRMLDQIANGEHDVTRLMLESAGLRQLHDPAVPTESFRRMISNLIRLEVVSPSLHGGAFDTLDEEMLCDQAVKFSRLGAHFYAACQKPRRRA